PNIPRMMGVNEPPPVVNDRIQPLAAHGVKLMSLGFLIERDQPAIWRGPIVMKIITQFLADLDWGQLDYLFVDMPPGTGDAQLSLSQSAEVSGVVTVVTPQDVSLGVARRGIEMFRQVRVPLLGVVENMSYFLTPDGQRHHPFGQGGARKPARAAGLPFLGEIPIDPRVSECGDAGEPIVHRYPDSPVAQAYFGLATHVGEELAKGGPE